MSTPYVFLWQYTQWDRQGNNNKPVQGLSCEQEFNTGAGGGSVGITCTSRTEAGRAVTTQPVGGANNSMGGHIVCSLCFQSQSVVKD